MKVIEYKDIDRAEWSALVHSSSTGTWFQTPEAYDFFASQPDLFQPFAVGIVAYPQPLPKRKGEEAYPKSFPKGKDFQLLFTHEGKGEEAYPKSFPKGKDFQSLFTHEGKGEEAYPQPPHDSFASVWGAHTADSTQYNLLKVNAIANRKTPTEAESVMWDLLKGNNLGLHFRRQHIILDYIVDFICLDKGLVIELDGGYHNDLQQKEYDEQRTAHLQKLGYTELRFTNEELLVNPDEVISKIKAVAESLPSLQGRTEERLSGRTGERPVLRAVCVGYVTVEKSVPKQFLTRRAIIIGGPTLADDATDEEVTALMEAVRKRPILNPSLKGRTSNLSSPLKGRERLLTPIYIETRNFNDYSKWRGAFEKAGFEYKKHLNFHIDCTDKEAMEAHLSENRKRQIKRAIKSGVEIAEAQSEQEIADWFIILQDLYKTKVKTPLFPLSFFLEYYRQGLGKYLLVKYEGKVIGGIMCPILDGKCIYEWYICGSDGEYKEQYPSVMATWAAMDYAEKHGLARFDVMGAGEPGVPYGVRDFKVEFGGELVKHGRFIHVCKPWLYRIGVMGVRMLRYRS